MVDHKEPAPLKTAAPVPVTTVTVAVASLAVEFLVQIWPDLRPALSFFPDRPNWWSPLTCLFVHDNLFHLLGNMVFLATVGPLVEFNRGKRWFLAIFATGGLAGVFVHSLTTIGRPEAASMPLVGASAAAASCLGYASVVFFGKRVPILPQIGVPVWSVGLLWAVLQAAGGAVRLTDDGGGVAFWSHAAGFVVGLVFSLVLRVPREQSLQLGHEVLNRLNDSEPQLLLAVAEKNLREHPGDARFIREKSNALVALGKKDEAAKALRPLVFSGRKKDRREAIFALAGMKRMSALTAVERLKLSEQLEECEPDVAIILVESVLTMGATEPERPHALFELALLLRETDADQSRVFVQELETRYALHPATSLARAKGLRE